jgi:hypothetical protein
VQLSFLRYCFILLLAIPAGSSVYAQLSTGLRNKSVSPNNDSIHLDTLSIIPESFLLLHGNDTVAANCYHLDAATAQLLLLPCCPRIDSLYVRYQVFPLLFTAENRRKDPLKLTTTPERRINPFLYTPGANERYDIFAMNGLNKSGSLARGISFGNNRDVSVNSSLNLQLSGKITENIELTMAATDDNLPIQPDGTTQQLQEFDRVYIQLSSKKVGMIAGDFFTTRPSGYFMNYNKRGQGLMANSNLRLGKTKDTLLQPQLNITAAVAISKGKFARNIVQGIEGNQGPYRLRGAENELFIVVLSGTERVFVDGQQMIRGQNNDYIIDYNTAEIIFTAKRLITKDKRIVVEFQYSDRNYARSLLLTNVEYRTPFWIIRLNAFSEQDSRNQPLQQTLTDDDKRTLTAVGDTLLRAVVSGIDSVGFSSDAVLYKQIDTLVSSISYNDIYVYSTNSDSAIYRLTFSFVGTGQGNYRQVNASANGKVYQWVAPVGGIPQGDYEPVILLITPKRKQLVTLGAEKRFQKQAFIVAEGAVSSNDLNTFSAFDSNDDLGYGFSLRAGDTLRFNDSLQLLTDASSEVVTRHFTALERYRAVEFERDWNLGFQNAGGSDWTNASIGVNARQATATQQLANAGIALVRKNRGMVGYRFGLFHESNYYRGFRHAVNTVVQHKGTRFAAEGSLLNASGTIGKNSFLRHKTQFIQEIGRKWMISGRTQSEESQLRPVTFDTLLGSSFSYFEWEVRGGTSDTTKRFFQLFYSQRTDRLPSFNDLLAATFAENRGGTIGLLGNPNQQVRLTINWRTLQIRRTQLAPQVPENVLLGRLEYNSRFWKGAITTTTFYEAGSGLEVRREFSYLEVPTGQGTYTWTDYNSNGVKELNEFEIAVFIDQANYIRIYTPTNQFIRVYTSQFSQSLNLRPSILWENPKGWKGFAARFSNQASYRVERKTISSDAAQTLVPRFDDINDTALVSLNVSVRNTVFFNQLSSKFGMDFTWQDIRGKSLLTNGLEARGNVSREIRIRWNITKALLYTAEGRDGIKTNTSEFFGSRNFRVRYYETTQSFSIQPGTAFRLSFNYRYADKRNTPDLGNEKLILQRIGTEIKYNVLSKGSFDAEFAFFNMDYSGSISSAVAYDMLEALKPGRNYTWRTNWQRALANNLQLTLGYEGRSSPGVRVIHTGTAQVRAMF